MVLSKLDEAVKLGPALDALIRHKLKVVAWPTASACRKTGTACRRMRWCTAGCARGGSRPTALDSGDVNLIFAAPKSGLLQRARRRTSRPEPPTTRHRFIERPTMRDPIPSPCRPDPGDGLRRLFARKRVQMVPVVSNPHVAFGGVMLERLCAGFTELGLHVLVVDASPRQRALRAGAPDGPADAIGAVAEGVDSPAARGLAIRHVDATGSTRPS